jgi:D-alanyl-D-alanine endopeptidase (penicillin-binding protein 7)
VSNSEKFNTFAAQPAYSKAVLFVLTVMSFPGWATAAGGDKLVPVKLAADAPGMIRFESCTRPAYPEQEAKQNHHGVVTLRFLVGADGKVKKSLVVTSSGYPALDEVALVAIAKCNFNPPVLNDKPVNAWIAVQYVWKPQ